MHLNGSEFRKNPKYLRISNSGHLRSIRPKFKEKHYPCYISVQSKENLRLNLLSTRLLTLKIKIHAWQKGGNVFWWFEVTIHTLKLLKRTPLELSSCRKMGLRNLLRTNLRKMHSAQFQTYCNFLQIDPNDLNCDLESLNKVSVAQLQAIPYRWIHKCPKIPSIYLFS